MENQKVLPMLQRITNKGLFLQKLSAFTLAEVLITLGIIGVVAAMTIPNLINQTQESEYKNLYKKAYTNLSQAFASASANKEIGELTGSSSRYGMEYNFAILQSYFKVVKTCTNSRTEGCWSAEGELWRGEVYTMAGFVDSSGMGWKLRMLDGNGVPTILVDTNGLKGPNQYGKDRFPLFLSIAGSQNVWTTLASPIGMPTKVAPFYDVSSANATSSTTFPGDTCPSYASHPCYYTTWLLEK